MPTFYEFFAGGGMARLGLGPAWTCLAANDLCPKKAAAYTENWGSEHFLTGCISALEPKQLPDVADLAWASFPCQDLSLAGKRRGIHAKRSGAFWPFWQLMLELKQEGRLPRVIALENVVGMLSAGGGQDFADVCHALIETGYRVGSVVLDASRFVPQSRKRVFLIAASSGIPLPESIQGASPDDELHPSAMRRAIDLLPTGDRRSWFWLTPPKPKATSASLRDFISREPEGVRWHSAQQTDRLMEIMPPAHRAKVEQLASAREYAVGALYKRMRPGPNGAREQRAEVRFDLAGCLRTPTGGSSRQTLVIIENGKVRTRLLSAREAARLMGIPDSYRLPVRYNDAYHLAGDGVVVPVVRYLREQVIEPWLRAHAPVGLADADPTAATGGDPG